MQKENVKMRNPETYVTLQREITGITKQEMNVLWDLWQAQFLKILAILSLILVCLIKLYKQNDYSLPVQDPEQRNVCLLVLYTSCNS